MERLVRLIGTLTKHRAGAPLAVLLRAVSPGDDSDEARRKMLSRDLEHLNALGYDIRNIADVGTDGVYVMRAHDNRLQVHLSPEQRGELLRAAIAAGLEGMAPHLGSDDGSTPAALPTSADLDLVQRGTTRHCRVSFTYKGEPRTVHPARVHSGPSGWYLSGREDGTEVVKEFVVSRMSDISLDAPGTAEVVGEPVRPSLDPLSWEVDPPTDVVLQMPKEHRVLVENLLGTPSAVAESGSALAMTYVVTHRRVFRNRLYELGTRVRVVSPDEVRAEILAELTALAGADA
jgi:predicted DNA-binding transcriptional regulator YafY